MNGRAPRHATVQQFVPGTSREEKAEGTDLFFDLGLWLLAVVPVVVVILLAALKRKRTPELPHVDELRWRVEVLESEVPVVVHVYRPWSIGDRVIEKQVEKLSESAEGRFRVLWLDVERNPGILERHATLERRTVALFAGGRLVWQATGVASADEMLAEIREFLDQPPPGTGAREVPSAWPSSGEGL